MIEEVSSIFPEKRVVYASFWQRFAAAFIDGILLMIPDMIISNFIDAPNLLSQLLYRQPVSRASYLTFFLSEGLAWIYFAAMVSSKSQATIGKMALSLKVSGMEGERISFGRATLRHFGKILSLATVLIGYFMMLWDKKSQTLHDKIADTIVTKNTPANYS